MAEVKLTTLSTISSGSFLTQLNNNLSKLAAALNNGVLWRAVGPAGGESVNGR